MNKAKWDLQFIHLENKLQLAYKIRRLSIIFQQANRHIDKKDRIFDIEFW